MGLKSIHVHLMNKYPGAKIERSESSLKAYSRKGDLLVAVEKNGQGIIVDAQKEHGAQDALCLSPIPKNARAFKLHKDGSIGQAEESERRAMRHKLASKFGGKVPAISEIAAAIEAGKVQAELKGSDAEPHNKSVELKEEKKAE